MISRNINQFDDIQVFWELQLFTGLPAHQRTTQQEPQPPLQTARPGVLPGLFLGPIAVERRGKDKFLFLFSAIRTPVTLTTPVSEMFYLLNGYFPFLGFREKHHIPMPQFLKVTIQCLPPAPQ